MTCGACEPDQFRKHHGGHVFGYTASGFIQSNVKKLYFFGASFVLWDEKPSGRVLQRDGIKNLIRISREGDTIIFASEKDLGKKHGSQKRAAIWFERNNRKVLFLK